MARDVVSPTHDVCLYFLALLLPPLAVFFKRGCAADFWINVCLSILGWIPGVLHAWYVISRSEGVYGTRGTSRAAPATGAAAVPPSEKPLAATVEKAPGTHAGPAAPVAVAPTIGGGSAPVGTGAPVGAAGGHML